MAINYRFVVRRGNSSDWTAQNPVILQGEFGLELDTGKLKMGDGATAWNSLDYIIGDTITQTITNGDTTHAPSGDAVFDALALKFDKAGGLLTGSVSYGVTPFTITAATLAGADTRRIAISSAGAVTATRGAYLVLFGVNAPSNAGEVNIVTAGGADMVFTGGNLRPNNDNSYSFGTGANRWSVIYAGTGTINTSDAREKANIRELTGDELAAAQELAAASRIYQWKSAIAEKGDAARLHCSPTVQSVIAIMEAHGLDPFRYGFVCYDEWDEQPELVESWEEERDDEGNVTREAGSEVVQEHRPAGNRYSLRPSELESFIAAGMAAKVASLEARLAALK